MNRRPSVGLNQRLPGCGFDGGAIPSGTTAAASLFTLGLNSYGDVKIGETVKIILEENGTISANQTDLFGNSEGLALAVYEVGTTVDNKDTKTKTVEILNSGAANFAGALEADSISGGIYATDSEE